MKIRMILCLCSLAAFLSGCEDFLTREPLDKQTNATYWQTESSLRSYAQDFYSGFFPGYAQDYRTFGGFFSGDNFTDDFLNLSGGELYFPTSAITDINASTSVWEENYDRIYKANVMIEQIPEMDLSEEVKNHWMGIARFFRAMAYSALAKVYGGVPYIDKVIRPEEDSGELYKDRSPYPFVAQKILEDYLFAVQNVRTEDGRLQVNRYVVGAYMSRDLLYHATWLKYHGTTVGPSSKPVDGKEIRQLLDGAIQGAKTVMDSQLFRIGNTYTELFASEDLHKNPEIVWYREYADGVYCNALMSYNAGENQSQGGITQDAVESYLCSDGLPVGQSPLYKGKDHPGIREAFQDRDPRLYQTVADSLRVLSAMGVSYTAGASPTGYASKKFLNDAWFAAGSPFCKNIQSPADAPCFRYAEVLLNYVEARYEVSRVGGEAFSQADLDLTINRLRDRQLVKWGEKTGKKMPPVTLSGDGLMVNGVRINDPARDPEVAPVLWEIRRERRVELILEGRRGEDLRRWAKYEYLNSGTPEGYPSKTFLGAYLALADYPGMKATDEKGEQVLVLFDPKDPSNKHSEKGYIDYLRNPKARVFKKGELASERCYLRAVPVSQIGVYKDKGFTLTQNPGWE